MYWDDCRYCNGKGVMKPVPHVAQRQAAWDKEVIEIAHECTNFDSCNKGREAYLWVPSSRIPTPQFEANYGSQQSDDIDSDYKLAHAAAQAVYVTELTNVQENSFDIIVNFSIIGFAIALFILVALCTIIISI